MVPWRAISQGRNHVVQFLGYGYYCPSAEKNFRKVYTVWRSLLSHLPPTNTHTHLFNGPLSGTTRVSRYQKGKTNLDFTEARDSEWQWYQLGHMQVCTSLQTDIHATTPPLSFFTGRMPFLPPNQQRQSTEGSDLHQKAT